MYTYVPALDYTLISTHIGLIQYQVRLRYGFITYIVFSMVLVPFVLMMVLELLTVHEIK